MTDPDAPGGTAARPDADLATKTARLDAYLDARGLEAVWFARPNSFAWLTGGSNVVDRSNPRGVAAAGYTADGDHLVVTDTVEADRLAAEEVPDDFAVEAVAWYESTLGEAVADRSPTPAAADFHVPGFETVEPTPLRQPLTARDVERYRHLGTEVAAAVESICRELQPEDVELEVAAGLGVTLGARDIEAPVVLVGGAERAQQYRHYTPTRAPLGDYALVSVTAERGGLFASATRTVAFDPPEWLEARHEAAATVEVSALGATRAAARAGGTAASVFGAVQDAYGAVGHPDEWRRHHQGGAAGYAGREWIATPTLERTVHAPMAYAWNPTVRGTKSEDTVLVTDDGFEVLTTTGEWPTTTVAAHGHDVDLDRPDVLFV